MTKVPRYLVVCEQLDKSNQFVAKESFFHTEPAYTKYRTVIRKTTRLKVIVCNIDKIWSLDLAFVDKLAQYNHDVKYLLVAVDCMSRYLRVQPFKSKYATTTAEAFKLMITTKQPKKIWVDKGRA